MHWTLMPSCPTEAAWNNPSTQRFRTSDLPACLTLTLWTSKTIILVKKKTYTKWLPFLKLKHKTERPARPVNCF